MGPVVSDASGKLNAKFSPQMLHGTEDTHHPHHNLPHHNIPKMTQRMTIMMKTKEPAFERVFLSFDFVYLFNFIVFFPFNVFACDMSDPQ